VVLIEPGLIRTRFEEGVLTSEATVAQENSPYAGLLAASVAATTGGYSNRMAAAGPERVARTVLKAVESRRPRSRYVVTAAARAIIATRTVGGDRAWDTLIGQRFRD
jgi:hypothetical protein